MPGMLRPSPDLVRFVSDQSSRGGDIGAKPGSKDGGMVDVSTSDELTAEFARVAVTYYNDMTAARYTRSNKRSKLLAKLFDELRQHTDGMARLSQRLDDDDVAVRRVVAGWLLT